MQMPFSYFFFDTYPGYFLQMTPFALLAAVLYFRYQKKRSPSLGNGTIALSALFPAYLTALLGLTLFIRFISDGYYILFYHHLPRPLEDMSYHWFTFTYSLRLDFFQYFRGESLGNILLFLPFGILYPLFHRGASWQRTLGLGILTSLMIENIQPFMDRSFDLNDLVLNTIGAALSTLVFYGGRRLVCRLKH